MQDKIDQSFLSSPELLEEIQVFERFLQKIGFKRIEGAIFGLLVLSERPLTSEEIEKSLKLSQSAVSLALKNLNHYGAVDSKDLPGRRIKLHFANDNSLSIAATVFRKREEGWIRDFREMILRVLEAKQEDSENSLVVKRMLSMKRTCDLALGVIDFVMQVAPLERDHNMKHFFDSLPTALDLLAKGSTPYQGLAKKMKDHFPQKLLKTIAEYRETSPGETNG